MTTNIIAIEADTLKCSDCGNEQEFIALTGHFYIGHIRGYKMHGITCKVCKATFSLESKTPA